MKSLIISAIVAFLFVGCGGGGFAQFYKPVMTDEQVKSAKSSGNFVDDLAPEVFFNNAEQFVAYRNMLEVEYECLLIGISSFNGGLNDIWWGTTSKGDAEATRQKCGSKLLYPPCNIYKHGARHLQLYDAKHNNF